MTRAYIKNSGVRFGTPGLAMAIAWPIVMKIFNDEGYDCRITSANDGKHRNGSKHYTDDAHDYSTKHIPGEPKRRIVQKCMEALPGYDVIFEYAGGDNEHLHIEYDPK